MWRMEPLPEVLTIGETAAALRVSAETVRRYIRDGVIGYSRPSERIYRIPRSEVERLLGESEAVGQ